MKKEIWYEVFVSSPLGTRTIAEFDTLKEARNFKASKKAKEDILYLEQKGKKSLHIDKWMKSNNITRIVGELK